MTHAELAKKAIAAVGTQAKLAAKIKAPPAFIYQWRQGMRPIPARFAIAIESATDSAVTRYQISPEIFGADPTTPTRKPRPVRKVG